MAAFPTKDKGALNVEKELWNGYDKLNFAVAGREGFTVCPETPLPGKPWAWRAEFFGAFDYVDRALLRRGWHLAYYRVSDMYGCPEAVADMAKFQDTAEKEMGLSPKAALFGFSRGGLYAVNYAAAYPERVSALYLDAPVLDIRSWPGGWGRGDGATKEWEECKAWYHLDEDSAQDFRQNPLDRIPELLAAKIPVILVAGDADTAVPFAENGRIFAARYQEGGGSIQVILKPGCGHHPHSLENPAPIVAFLEKYGR